MGGLKAITLAAAGTLLALGATAQGRPDGAGGNGPAQAGSDPIAGAYISHYTVDFIDGTPCQILVDLGFVETCSTSQMVMLNADGTVHTSDNNASRGARSDAIGTWTSSTRSTYSTRLVTLYYDANGNAVSIDVVESRSQANADFSGTQGTFTARNYNIDQDPFDPSETPNFTNTGSFVTQRVPR